MLIFENFDIIIVIIYANNSINILRSSFFKFLLSLSAHASAFAPSASILFPPKIMRKWKNNRLLLAIIIKNTKFVWILKIIIYINIRIHISVYNI